MTAACAVGTVTVFMGGRFEVFKLTPSERLLYQASQVFTARIGPYRVRDAVTHRRLLAMAAVAYQKEQKHRGRHYDISSSYPAAMWKPKP